MHPRPTRLLAALLLLTLLIALPHPAASQPPTPPADPPASVVDTPDASAERLEQLRAQLEGAVRDVLAGAPGEVGLRSLAFDGRVLTIDLSAEARALADEERLPELLGPIDGAVNDLLDAAELDEQRSLDYLVLIDGAPLAAPAAPADEAPGATLDVINGRRVVINPGHGWYNDAGVWRLQRGWWWGIIEDFINVDLAIQLRDRLAAVGADVRSPRALNKAAGTHPGSGKPLWEVGAAAYTQHVGAPSSVWGVGSTGMSRDIMARPYYANWVGANAVISIHNNGGRGCGTETWYDTSNAYASQSYALAQRIQAKIIERVRAQWNAGWCNRGVKGSNGGYGEIRAANAPAVLIELAFMDTESDNRALQSPTFRSIVTQAISDAVIEHFGGVAVSCPAGTFRGEYFANTTLSGSPAFVRCDASVNMNWGTAGPGGGLSADNFSVRWRGTHYLSGGTYAFVGTADDGLRVSVDGYPLISAWVDQGVTQYRATRTLATGNHSIVMEYYERSGGAFAQLFWNVNLALHSPAFAQSQESSALHPALGNDGSGATRWSSRQSWTLGEEWWWTKLGARQDVTQVAITWENAYAADHCIAWWSDGETGAQMYCYTISAPGRYTYNIGTRQAQYVGVLMRRRPWGTMNYSFWEFGAYRWGATAAADDRALTALTSEPVSIPLPGPASASYQVFLPQLSE